MSGDFQLEGYELLERIGQGGMAVVWKARQVSLDRVVAIKVLSAAFKEPDARDRFRAETRHAARLRHPSVVQVYDAGEQHGVAYLVMEYIEGRTLGDRISAQGPLPPDELHRIARAVAEAMDHAWDKECMIHCDLKPDNILLEADTGAVKVADLGLSRAVGIHREGAAAEGLIVGTPNYVSPEQAAGEPDLDCRTDIYAFGATLYHAATGRMPFKGKPADEAMRGHREGYLDDPVDFVDGFPDAVAWLLEKLLARNRAYRPLLWREVLRDLDRAADGHLPDPLPEPGRSTMRRSMRRVRPRIGDTPKLVVKASRIPPRPTLARAPDGPAVTAAHASGALLLALVAGGLLVGGTAWWALQARQQRIAAAESAPTDGDASPAPAPEAAPATNAEPPPGFVWEHPAYQRAKVRLDQAGMAHAAWNAEGDPARLEAAREAAVEAMQLFEMCEGVAPPGVDMTNWLAQTRRMLRGIEQDLRRLREAEPGVLALAPAGSAPAARNDSPVQRDLYDLLNPHAAATPESFRLNPDVAFQGIPFLTPRTETLNRLGNPQPINETPVAMQTFPGGGLRIHRYVSPRPEAYDELRLVTDRLDQVALIQFVQDRPAPPRMPETLFSDRWTLVDPVLGTARTEPDERIAHRLRPTPPLLRIDSEWLGAPDESGTRTSRLRLSTLMPSDLAGRWLFAIEPEP